MKKTILATAVVLAILSSDLWAANYVLEIISPQTGITGHSRYKKAYPGIEYQVPVGVFGGLYPFSFELTGSTTCGGTIDADTGTITWSNPQAGDDGCTFAVQVTDDESSTDSISWTVEVTDSTDDFIFIQADYSGTESGSISQPFNSIEDVWGSDGLTTTYNDRFIYWRGGTHYMAGGDFDNTSDDYHFSVNMSTGIPHVWIGYPGESVVIDLDSGTGNGSNGGYLHLSPTDSDMWFSNIRFQDAKRHILKGRGARYTIFDCYFYNLYVTLDGYNSSMVMYGGNYDLTAWYGHFTSNTFDYVTGSEGSFAKSYSMNKCVWEYNDFINPDDQIVLEGLAIKGHDQYSSVRKNTFDGEFTASAIDGNMHNGNDIDISFNLILNSNDGSGGATRAGALTVNYGNTADGDWYFYRNTFEGAIQYRGATGGPFHFDNNVIINETASYDDPDGSLLHPNSGTASSSILDLGTGANADLVGNAADGIIDASGDLTESYSAYVGTHGYQTSSSTTTTSVQNVSGNFVMGN